MRKVFLCKEKKEKINEGQTLRPEEEHGGLNGLI